MSRSYRIVPFLLLSLAAPAMAQTSMAGMNGMGGPSTAADTAQLARIRRALDKYRDPIAAVRDGYFSTLACMEFPAGEPGAMGYRPGGMGVHFLNMNYVGPQLDTLHPQVLMYEPVGDSLRLVAAEWFMPAQLSAQPPHIFGRDLDGPMEGHAPIMPAELHHWDLHVWLWKDNPSGVFSPTNPTVTCPPRGRYTVRGGPPKIVTQ
jgi:hypothetical protein